MKRFLRKLYEKAFPNEFSWRLYLCALFFGYGAATFPYVGYWIGLVIGYLCTLTYCTWDLWRSNQEGQKRLMKKYHAFAKEHGVSFDGMTFEEISEGFERLELGLADELGKEVKRLQKKLEDLTGQPQ